MRKVSIIMPCFNVEHTLARALDSIFMQEVDFSYEVLIVDDASTDSTVLIAKQYAKNHPQIQLICNPSNQGNAYSYYTGLKAAQGEYICVLDGDDYYTIPDKLQRQVNFLDGDTEEEYVGTATHYIIDLGNNKVSIPDRSNYKWCSYADFLTQKTAYYHTSTYMYRNIFRGNIPPQIGDVLYRGDTPRTMFHLLYSGKKIRILDFVGSAYTYERNGIWSGMKQKQQYEYQIAYQTQHKNHVLSDFERAAADKQIQFYKEQMEGVKNDYRCYPSISIDQALTYAADYAGIFAFGQKDFVLQHVYASSYLDTLCASLGYIDSVRNPNHIQKEVNLQHICIVNGVLNPKGGGIFAEIEQLIDLYADKKVYLLVTDMTKVGESASEILRKHSNLTVLCPPETCKERLGWFRKNLAEIAPYRTYYYCSHKDTYGVALAQKGCCENITLFSFDHGYLCGISNPNLNKIIAKRPTDYWLLKKKFGEKVIYIPAWSDDFYSKEGRYYVPGKNHSALITASGAARFYKVDGHIPFRYLDMVVVLLKKTNGIHYHFGELPDKAKEELREKMESENIAQEHFVHIPWSDDLPEELLKRHVDVFIEPFPVVSYKLTLEVLSAGVPVIAQQGLTRMSITDFLPKDAFIWKNAEEFLSILSNVTREEWKEQSENALKYFKEYHSVEQIKNYLRENVGLPEPKKYVYPDSDLLDITSSFQLFENYFQISIMSRDKKEDKKTPKKDGGFCEKLEELYFQQKKDAAITKKMILGAIEKTLRRNTIEHLDYHITDHCNLNCQGCSVFAPVAEKRFADLDSFEKDMRDLHTLIGDAIQQIHLLGGEPLLHPKAEQFAQICRSVFRGGGKN